MLTIYNIRYIYRCNDRDQVHYAGYNPGPEVVTHMLMALLTRVYLPQVPCVGRNCTYNTYIHPCLQVYLDKRKKIWFPQLLDSADLGFLLR